MVEAGKNVQSNVKDRIANVQNTLKNEMTVLRNLADDIRKRARTADEPTYTKEKGVQGVKGSIVELPIALIKGTADNLFGGIQNQAKITRRWMNR